MELKEFVLGLQEAAIETGDPEVGQAADIAASLVKQYDHVPACVGLVTLPVLATIIASIVHGYQENCTDLVEPEYDILEGLAEALAVLQTDLKQTLRKPIKTDRGTFPAPKADA